MQALIKAWDATCKSSAPAKLLFPKGTFLTGGTVFQGPCNNPTPIIIEIQGTILSSTDLSLFTKPIWICINNVDGIIVTGEGTLDGQGDSIWHHATGNLLPVVSASCNFIFPFGKTGIMELTASKYFVCFLLFV